MCVYITNSYNLDFQGNFASNDPENETRPAINND